MVRTMIHETYMAKYFWTEVVNTACYVQNRIYIRHILNKTSYELFKGRRPNISYFQKFGCTCYILDNKVYLKKFDFKAQKVIFLGYSERSKTYKVYNSETNTRKNRFFWCRPHPFLCSTSSQALMMLLTTSHAFTSFTSFTSFSSTFTSFDFDMTLQSVIHLSLKFFPI